MWKSVKQVTPSHVTMHAQSLCARRLLDILQYTYIFYIHRYNTIILTPLLLKYMGQRQLVKRSHGQTHAILIY